MMSRFAFASGILPLILLLIAGPAAAGQYSHERDGVVVGLDIGPGWAKAEYTSSDGQLNDSKYRSAVSGLFRLGFAKSEELMVSLDINGWSYQNRTFEHQLFATTASVTWFPGGESFFLTGGAGSGSLSVTQSTATGLRKFDERGFSFLFATGFEFRVAPEYAIGLSANYFRVGLGEVQDLRDVSADNFAICFHVQWYMTD